MQHAVQIDTVISAEAIHTFPALRPLLGHRVRVTVDQLDQDSESEDSYQPISQIGQLALQARRAHLDAGGKLMNADEITEEVRQRRGGRSDV
ncbi:hypothetical protein [Thiorhodovibrio frisius]|uniref:Uncharacterized protein n=1 Tax=Thiorhodovibrio frisius TaxID=631362 RepID=H8Z779_9GAMM|nr:hypothetical protein [Thiorhodovibrio frisius]EIC19795.1 hypothetical protein Thi970DRAFT_03396 [Thiorhodovibrio frisius]MBK5967466.1 hypothetical protein [Thiorhodovibrio winogradskyi]WPL15009.1 hypothetical protein Thiosp_04871 [Thiorhodovibrio litoralis]WPL20229.1 hypothetical protein Thiofri_00305 [Thiorhodovibrio frisius]